VRARLTVRNHRGAEVPAVLGFVLAAGGLVSTMSVAAFDRVPAAGWIAAAGAGLVFVAGLVDDLTPAGPRGLRAHVRGLAEGHVSSGIVKLIVVTAVAVVTVAAGPPRTSSARLTGVILISGAANVWNGLDVRPGRAVKFSLLAAPAVLACPWPSAPFAPGVALAALLVLPWDVGERAMLGDAGANLLGLAVGVALYGALTDAQVAVAAVVAVGLNALGETFTLTRAIDAVPPLRWYDRLGTRAP
jgi:hypothetical protein